MNTAESSNGAFAVSFLSHCDSNLKCDTGLALYVWPRPHFCGRLRDIRSAITLSDKDSIFLLRELVQNTAELVKWTKPQGIAKVKEVLTATLKRNEEKLVYHHSNGRSSQEVAKLAGVSFTTVTIYWKRWSTLGVVEPMKVQGGTRYRSIFSLEDLGIEVPKTSTVSTEIVNTPASETEIA